NAEAFVALGFFSGFFGVHVFIRVDRGAIHDALFDVDRHVEPDGQRDRVAGARVDFLSAPVAFDDNPRKEGVVAQVVDHDVVHVPAQLCDDRLEQVMGQRALDVYFLELDGDRFRFKGADKNWKIASALVVFQNHHAKLSHEADADAITMNLDHGEYPEPLKCSNTSAGLKSRPIISSSPARNQSYTRRFFIRRPALP